MTTGTDRESRPVAPEPDLRTCRIEMRGDWHAPMTEPQAVIRRMRDACLQAAPLCSDRQPRGLWVEDRNAGFPCIWLHDDPTDVAWIDVNVSDRDWRRLAYQFGHELGHVLCNSWRRDAFPHPPSQWLEEVLVDAFSLRGLGLLANDWDRQKPVDGVGDYGSILRTYRRDLLAKYQRLAREQGTGDLLHWRETQSGALRAENGLGELEQAAVPAVLGLIEPQPVLIADYGALNRWPERSTLPVPEYLARWRDSCRELDAPGRLPVLIADVFGIAAP